MEQEQQTTRERALTLIKLLVPDWRPTLTQILWTIRITIVLSILIVVGYSYDITLWDWLELLIVPAAIAAGGFWLAQQQQERESQRTEQRVQDETLQAYLDYVSERLDDENQPLQEAQAGDTLGTVLSTRTLTILPTLSGERKRIVVRFLYEANLITNRASGLVLKLDHANLDHAELRGIYLQNANLQAVFLRHANLYNAFLRGIDLFNSNLRYANLRGADLSPAVVNGTARPANLKNIDWLDVDLDEADLRGADLRGAISLTQVQIESAKGDRYTLLPQYVSRPVTWAE